MLENDLLMNKKLDPKEISLHQSRLSNKKASLHFKILKTLTLDNSGIIDLEKYNFPRSSDKFAAFIPSAGAASRYYASIKELLLAIENKDLSAIKKELSELDPNEVKSWAIPNKTRSLLVSMNAQDILDNSALILKEIALPKALQPAFTDGTSFLDVKGMEHSKLDLISKEFYIINPAARDDFDKAAQGKPYKFLEQGPKLSTIRFNRDGSPYKDDTGAYTVVPAGHGSLTKLIPEVAELAPECDSIFIKNIDNVNGDKDEVLAETEKFLNFHSFVLHAVKDIRQLLSQDAVEAEKAAATYIEKLEFHDELKEAFSKFKYKSLWHLLSSLFHLQAAFASELMQSFDDELKLLQFLYSRPVNTVGQVPNSGKDVGASPVLCEDDKGRQFVIALEPPHASSEDKKNILANPKVATHFNPAFVAAEIIEDASAYKNPNYDFWIKAEKHFKGTDVMYHETVLYELLGNSIMANACFPAIKRSLFNPHKSVKDTTLHNKSHFFK